MSRPADSMAGFIRLLRLVSTIVAVVLLAVASAPPAEAEGIALSAPSAPPGIPLPAGWIPLLEETPPIEQRLRVIVRDAVRAVRRSFKFSVYLVSNSPTWWGRRVKRLFWPLVFAAAALFFDTGLLSAWKNQGARVLATYVPMMIYVYARLFVSRRASVLARLGVVAALAYGVWRHDLIAEGGWSSIGFRRLDDLIIIAVAVRVFVATCPEDVVEHFAERAIALRNRVFRRSVTTGAP